MARTFCPGKYVSIRNDKHPHKKIWPCKTSIQCTVITQQEKYNKYLIMEYTTKIAVSNGGGYPIDSTHLAPCLALEQLIY